MNYMKTLKPIELDFITNFPYVTFDTILNRTAYAPIDTFIKGKVAALNLNDGDIIRLLSVASQIAPNLYAADKTNCYVKVLTTDDGVLTRDASLNSTYDIAVTYLTGKTYSVDNDATKTEWMDYLSKSVEECALVYSQPIRTAQLELDIKAFIKASNNTIIESFNIPASKEPAPVLVANNELNSEL